MLSLQSFHEHYANSHARLLSLWKLVLEFRRQFVDTKSSTDLDLAQLRSEMSRVSRNVQSACIGLTTSLHNDHLQRHVRRSCLTKILCELPS